MATKYRRGRVKTYRLISHREKQTLVHYADPKYRANLRPLCRVSTWQQRVWEIDPAEGLGAEICGRCILYAERRVEQERALWRRKRKRLHRQNKAEELAKNRAYKATEAYKRQRKINDRINREHINAKTREYRARQREQGSLTSR